jgi:hypothetical protein
MKLDSLGSSVTDLPFVSLSQFGVPNEVDGDLAF